MFKLGKKLLLRVTIVLVNLQKIFESKTYKTEMQRQNIIKDINIC